MSEYNGPEKRTTVSNPDEQFEIDTTRIVERAARERTPIDQIKLREEGKDREKIMAAVLDKAAKLFGYSSDRPLENEVQPVAATDEPFAEGAAQVAAETAKLSAEAAELPPERADLLKIFEKQYSRMGKILARFEIPLDGMPSFEQVKQGLTPEVLALASKLEEPSLLLISPTTRQEKVAAIDSHRVKSRQEKTETINFDDDDLWNGGRAKTKRKWTVSIVEGRQHIEEDPEINVDSKSFYEMAKAWLKKLEDQGLEAMEGADEYLTFMMKALAKGKQHSGGFTNLNAKTLKETGQLANGMWGGKEVTFFIDEHWDTSPTLRLRASIPVNIEEPALIEADPNSAAQTAGESTKQASEKILQPEQQEMLLSTLWDRFEINRKLHENLVWVEKALADLAWADVEKALRANPEKLWSLAQMEATGGQPDVISVENGEFVFGDCSAESPEGRRNVVFDKEAEEHLKKHLPNEKCNGNAAEMLAAYGAEIMSIYQYSLLQTKINFDKNTRSLVKTENGGGIIVGRDGSEIVSAPYRTHGHFDDLGFRAVLRVPKA